MPSPSAHIPNNRGNADQSDAPNVHNPLGQLLPEPLPSEPWAIFRAWFDAAHTGKVQPNPNAMTIASIDPDGRPSARIVLCKLMDLSASAGHIVFFTNYTGRKGRALDANPFAAAVFHWDDLDKQARIEGPVLRSPEAESDAYFRSRPWMSRLGAWTSNQSEPIASRAAMVEQFRATCRRFGLNPDALPPADAQVEIPRPQHWGGYRLLAERVELWCGGEGRLHDRAAWVRSLRCVRPGIHGTWEAESAWRSTRVQP